MKTEPDYALVQKFHEQGLLMLVNMAVLWPRGLALRIWLDDDGAAYGLDIVDFGEYMAGFDDTDKDRDLATTRMLSLVASELAREEKFTDGS